MRLIVALSNVILPNHSNAVLEQASDSCLYLQQTAEPFSDAVIGLLEQEAAVIYGGSAAPVEQASSQPTATTSRWSRSSNSASQPLSLRQGNGEWSPVLQNVLDQPPSEFPARLIVAGLLFGCVFGAWAWFGRVQEVSYAQGRLEPKGAVYKIQPVTQGEIAQILVKEGETVKAGQAIAVLDNRLAQAEVDRLRQSLVGYQLQYAQLRGQMEQTHQELQTRQVIAQANIQGQEAAIAQAQSQAKTARQTIALLQAENNAYQSRLARLQPLVDEGAIAQEQLFDVEQSVREQKRMITQNQGEIEQHLTEADRLRAGLAQKQAEGQQSELEAQQRFQQLKREAVNMEASIAETQTLLQAAQTKLEQMSLYAPIGGVISSLNVHNAGEVIQPSQTIAEIGPDGVPLVLSAILPNREAGLVHAGMQVQVKVDAFPYQEYGVVSGNVISVSPDTKSDEQLGEVYEVKVSLNANSKGDRGIALKAGQTASAEIITRQRRVIDLLLDPIKKLQGGVNM